MKRVTTPLEKRKIVSLKAGDKILLTGFVYTARDQAHKRLLLAIKQADRLPIDIKGQIIYYCGPTATPKGRIIGSCGPTTASRMDEFSSALLKAGLCGMIGKGRRSKEIISAIKRYQAVYFLTYAGCGALLSSFVIQCKIIAYPDLGPEAIHRLYVENFPLIVGIDSKGGSLF